MIARNLFCELIQTAISNRDALSNVPTAKEWLAIYEESEKQAIVGVMLFGLERLPSEQRPPQELLLQWIGIGQMTELQNEQINSKCVKIQEELNDAGLRSAILKGQGVAYYYPKELSKLRQPGDIDVWVEGGREVVLDYAMKRCPTREFDAKHIHYHVFQDTEVELHWVPVFSYIPSKNRILEIFFGEEHNRQMANSVCLSEDDIITTPDADFNVVYLLLHIYGHFLYEGIGLRQMMDYYFVLLQVKRKSAVMDMVRLLKMEYFVASVMYVMQSVFGIDDRYLLCKANRKGGEVMLQEIMNGGNFGSFSSENQFSDESFWQYAKKRLMRRLRLFRYEPTGAFWRLVFRVKLEIWKRRMYNKYGV